MPIRHVDCEAVEPLLAPFGEPDSDAVLGADDREAVARHLALCRPCREQAEACQRARAALRANAATLATPAPPVLAARCRALAARPSPRRATRLIGWTAGAAAAAAILFVFLMPAQAIATQLAVDHMKCTKLGGSALTGTAAELEEAWRVRRRQLLTIPDSSPPQGLRLTGLRRCFSTDGSVAHVTYDHHGEAVSLFILGKGSRALGGTPRRDLEALGHKAVLWTQGADTYVLIGRDPGVAQTAQWMQEQIRLKTED